MTFIYCTHSITKHNKTNKCNTIIHNIFWSAPPSRYSASSPHSDLSHSPPPIYSEIHCFCSSCLSLSRMTMLLHTYCLRLRIDLPTLYHLHDLLRHSFEHFLHLIATLRRRLIVVKAMRGGKLLSLVSCNFTTTSY